MITVGSKVRVASKDVLENRTFRQVYVVREIRYNRGKEFAKVTSSLFFALTDLKEIAD